ncbi:DUF4258 domain-containing protein [Streptomyces shenzhenensis]|uniref:DUF4258 domain-containing protein n=1 Tax=Streptomyces shenzhenensis TaxID=943815 RepID=UPI0015F12592|nr:DUF4258 domain-containing protein [Streptomyces shenzhenensis]
MTAFDFARVRVTSRAWDAMKRRDVAPEDLADVLRAPDVAESHNGRTRFVRGPLAVVVAVDPDGAPVVVTVLLRSRAQWGDDDTIRRAC